MTKTLNANTAGGNRASWEEFAQLVAGAGVMPVPDAHLLLAMGRAHARIYVEHDASRRAATVHKVDPLAGQIIAERFSGAASHCVSKRLIWLGEAAQP